MCTVGPELASLIKDYLIPVLGVILSGLVAYYVADRAVQAEIKKGRVLLQSLAQRYFISFWNCFDMSNGNIKNDSLSKSQHMAELQSIVDDFSQLTTNSFYQRMIDRTPHLVKTQVFARRELINHKEVPNFALNIDTAKVFAELYRESRRGKDERLPIEDIIEKVEKM